MNVFEGKLISKEIKIGIVASRFNEFITSKLLSGALDGLKRHEVKDEDIDVAWVPRLRYIGSMAKIECAEEDFELLMDRRQELVSNLKAIGFKTVTLDLSGYQCGSMNEVKK